MQLHTSSLPIIVNMCPQHIHCQSLRPPFLTTANKGSVLSATSPPLPRVCTNQMAVIHTAPVAFNWSSLGKRLLLMWGERRVCRRMSWELCCLLCCLNKVNPMKRADDLKNLCCIPSAPHECINYIPTWKTFVLEVILSVNMSERGKD